MTTAKADKGKSEAREYAYATGKTRRNPKFHTTPASEIRKAFIGVGWVGRLRISANQLQLPEECGR